MTESIVQQELDWFKHSPDELDPLDHEKCENCGFRLNSQMKRKNADGFLVCGNCGLVLDETPEMRPTFHRRRGTENEESTGNTYIVNPIIKMILPRTVFYPKKFSPVFARLAREHSLPMDQYRSDFENYTRALLVLNGVDVPMRINVEVWNLFQRIKTAEGRSFFKIRRMYYFLALLAYLFERDQIVLYWWEILSEDQEREVFKATKDLVLAGYIPNPQALTLHAGIEFLINQLDLRSTNAIQNLSRVAQKLSIEKLERLLGRNLTPRICVAAFAYLWFEKRDYLYSLSDITRVMSVSNEATKNIVVSLKEKYNTHRASQRKAVIRNC